MHAENKMDIISMENRLSKERTRDEIIFETSIH